MLWSIGGLSVILGAFACLLIAMIGKAQARAAGGRSIDRSVSQNHTGAGGI
jgi:hypothetical protein